MEVTTEMIAELEVEPMCCELNIVNGSLILVQERLLLLLQVS